MASEQKQFQRRILEERFNRILDDFAHDDLATRAGAADRIVTMAQVVDPGSNQDTNLSEANYPFYFSVIRLLAQRLVIGEDERLCRAYQDALFEILSWTQQRVEAAEEGNRRKAADVVQAKVLHHLAKVNRVAYADWLTSLAKCLKARFEDEQIKLVDGENVEFVGSLIKILIEREFEDIPRMKWSSNLMADHHAYHIHFSKPRFKEEFFEHEPVDEDEELAILNQATRHLRYSRDVLAKGIRSLPMPVLEPLLDDVKTIPGGAFEKLQRQQVIAFDGCFLQGANLYASKLQGASVTHANLIGASISQSRLEGVNFVESSMAFGDISRVKLTEADLFNVDLTGTFLFGVDFSDVKHISRSVLTAEFRERKPVWGSDGTYKLEASGLMAEREQAQLEAFRKRFGDQSTSNVSNVGSNESA